MCIWRNEKLQERKTKLVFHQREAVAYSGLCLIQMFNKYRSFMIGNIHPVLFGPDSYCLTVLLYELDVSWEITVMSELLR